MDFSLIVYDKLIDMVLDSKLKLLMTCYLCNTQYFWKNC